MSSNFLDNQNFKIDSVGWEIEELIWIINGQNTQIKVKINFDRDIREYVSGVPAAFIGQQLFTYAAALRETAKVWKSLPQDQYEFHKVVDAMPGDNDLQKYKNYLNTSKVQLAGCYSSGLHVFDDIWVWAYYWLDDWTRLALSPTTRNVVRRDETMGYMISLDR